MNTDWSKTTRYIVAVSLVLLGFLILYLARSLLPLLIIATLIAVILRPIIMWLHIKARLPRGLAVALVYLVAAILVPLAVLLAIPAIVDAVRYVAGLDYQSILRGAIDWLRSTLLSIKAIPLPAGGMNLYIDQAVDSILTELARETVVDAPEPPSVGTIIGSLGSALTTTFRTAAGMVGTVFSQVALMLFMFLTSIYISLSAHTFPSAFQGMIPARFRPEISTLFNRIGRMWNAFFRGQLTLMIIIGVISWLGLTILGVPGAVYLGIIAGLLEIIPSLGPLIATIPAVIVALLQGSTYLPVSTPIFALIVLIFYILVQQLENNLIVPRVLGGAVELPALVVITGVLVGAEIAGLLGALLASPVIATLREIVRYAYRKILGENPFPPEEKMAEPADREPSRLRVMQDKAVRFVKSLSSKTLPGVSRVPKSKPGAKIFTPKK